MSTDQHRQRIDLDDNSGIDVLGFRLDYGREIRSGLVVRREDKRLPATKNERFAAALDN